MVQAVRRSAIPDTDAGADLEKDGRWRSPVARLVWDQEIGGSNPPRPTSPPRHRLLRVGANSLGTGGQRLGKDETSLLEPGDKLPSYEPWSRGRLHGGGHHHRREEADQGPLGKGTRPFPAASPQRVRVKNGIADVAGVPEELIEQLSKRSREIRGSLEAVTQRINAERVHLGLAPVEADSAKAMDIAARETRAAKLSHVATAELRAVWRGGAGRRA